MESYVRECVINPRKGDDPLFVIEDAGVFARLNGYAIIPVEDYRRLKELESDIARTGIVLSRTKDGVRWRVH